jgi:hypothetical protein
MHQQEKGELEVVAAVAVLSQVLLHQLMHILAVAVVEDHIPLKLLAQAELEDQG